MWGDVETDIVIMSYVAGYFADMCNELKRGDRFEWANFPYKAAEHAIHGLSISNLEYDEKASYESALGYAEHLVHRAGL